VSTYQIDMVGYTTVMLRACLQQETLRLELSHLQGAEEVGEEFSSGIGKLTICALL